MLIAANADGVIYGIIASVAETFLFNYFFAEPYLTFSVNDPIYFITFVIMTITSVVTGTLTSKVKESALQANLREKEANVLYKLTNELTDASDMDKIASIAAEAAGRITNSGAACLCFDIKGDPNPVFVQMKESGELIHRFFDKKIEGDLKQRILNLRTVYDVGEEFIDWPIYGKESALGVLRIPKICEENLTEIEKRMIRSIIESTSMAMDRYLAEENRRKIREDIIRERYRGNLLRAISHDLRTPLSGIMGPVKCS